MCVSVMALIASVILVLRSPRKLGFHEKTTVLTYPHRKSTMRTNLVSMLAQLLDHTFQPIWEHFTQKLFNTNSKLERHTIMLTTDARIDHNGSFYMCTVKTTQQCRKLHMQPTNKQTTAMGFYAQEGYIPQIQNLTTEGPA